MRIVEAKERRESMRFSGNYKLFSMVQVSEMCGVAARGKLNGTEN